MTLHSTHLIAYAQLKGLMYEFVGAHTQLDPYAKGVDRYRHSFMNKEVWYGRVSMMTRPGVWYHCEFDQYVSPEVGAGWALSGSIYSQNNGETSKSFVRLSAFESSVCKALGLNSDDLWQQCKSQWEERQATKDVVKREITAAAPTVRKLIEENADLGTVEAYGYKVMGTYTIRTVVTYVRIRTPKGHCVYNYHALTFQEALDATTRHMVVVRE